MKRKLSVAIVAVFLVLLLFSSVAYAALSGGTTFSLAPNAGMGSTAINYNSSVTYFRFVAPVSYEYVIYSSDITGDSYGYLYNSSGGLLASNDDSGGNLNFKITYVLRGGTTYYIGVRNYSGTSSNTCNLHIDYGNAPPIVTDANISISGATGVGGTYKIGDTLTATWNNTSGGDNNSDISYVRMNLSQFGGGSSVTATNSSGTWTSQYTFTTGSIDAANRNISVTATDTGSLSTTASDSSNAKVDNQPPSVTNANISISGASGNSGIYVPGDTVTATWDNTSFGDKNSDISSATVDFSEFGGGSSVSASNNSGTYTATYTLTSGSIDSTSLNISITATDDAGNFTTASDTTDASVDNQSPSVTDANISISGASGNCGIYVPGDTVTATWDNTSSGNDNDDIISVSFDFNEFGGNSSVSALQSSGSWVAEYTIIEDTINATNCNVSLTATDDAGQDTTASDSTDATVDSSEPTVILSDNEGDNIVKGGDTVVITATFSEPMSSTPQISIADGGVSSEVMTNSGDSITWTYIWTVPLTDTLAFVSVSGADVAGNLYSGDDEIEFLVDSTSPIISGVSNNGVYVESINISFNEGVAFLNDKFFASESTVYKIGDYSLKVTDQAGNSSLVNFSICLEKTVVTSNRLNYQLIDIERETDDGKTNVMLNVNSEVLDLILNSRFEDKDITVEVFKNTRDKSIRSFYLCMPLTDIELLRSKSSILTIETPIGKLILDPTLINMERLSESFGEISSEDIMVEISISPSHHFRKYAINRLADINNFIVIANPVTFDMRCYYGDKIVVSVNFTDNLEMWIPINKAYSLANLSAVRLMPDMTLNTTAAETVLENGIYYAKFTQTMNGTFAIVQSQ